MSSKGRIGMAAATFLAVCGAFAALGDTVEEREKRTDEIAQWLPAEPKAHGAFDVRDFGAKGDGETKDTAAIQRAIDAASAAGGGEVLLPKGIYLCGSVFLKNGVDFHIAEGAVLKGSPGRPSLSTSRRRNYHSGGGL